MFRYLRDERGVTLVTVMIIILLMTLLGAGILTSAIMENKVIQSLEDQKQAFYLAQAGIEYARFQLQKSLNWRTTGYTETLGNGQFTLKVTDSGAQLFKISSTGKVGRISRTLEVGGNYTIASPTAVVDRISGYEVLGGSDIVFNNNANVLGDADLRSNGDILFNHNGYIEGEAIASGDVGGVSDDKAVEGAQVFPIPDVDWNKLYQDAISSGRYMTSWDENNFKNGAVNYIDANVFVTKLEMTLDGVLVVDGDFVIDNKTDISTNTGLMIFVRGNLTLYNQKSIEAAIYATGSINFYQQTYLRGVVYSEKTVTFHNNTDMYLDTKGLYLPTVTNKFVATGEEINGQDSMSFTYWNEM